MVGEKKPPKAGKLKPTVATPSSNGQAAIYSVPRSRTNHSPVGVVAGRHLCKADRNLKAIIDRCGPCTLAPRRRYFIALCEAIVSQQLAVKAAATIFARFCGLFERRTPTPERLLAMPDAMLLSAGLSNQKLRYLRDLAEKFVSGEVPRHRLARMTDDAIIESLTRVKGIGVWTAQMFLIFVLNRPDVWPVDDLGLRKAVQTAMGLPALPDARSMHAAAEDWRPYRTFAAWYLWRSLENKPMSA